MFNLLEPHIFQTRYHRTIIISIQSQTTQKVPVRILFLIR